MENKYIAYDGKLQQSFFEKPISVSEYISVLNKILASVDIKVMGEVSGMQVASSGHIYFSLKDEKNGDIINCALWSSIYRMCGVKLENGMQIIVSGNADIYPVRGSLTFKVRTVELVGEGALKRAYDELKAKLSREGIFNKERKRAIPKYPQKIGVITSVKGAAIHDFINNLGKFGFKVYICDSRVEGQDAVKEILNSLKIMKKKEIDVLAIIRGGGSLESLMAFDNEMLVREIAKFPVPVVAGIGHHEDVTLVALTADTSESTPTAAAIRLSSGFQKAKETVLIYEKNIENSYYNLLYQKKRELYEQIEVIIGFFYQLLEKYKKGEEKIRRVVSLFNFLIKEKEKRLKDISKTYLFSLKNELYKIKIKIQNIEEVIFANDPKKQLRLGYAIMKKNGKIIKNILELKKGEIVDTILSDGEISSEVIKIKETKYDKKK
jgi:exodeoxyribonuclease VII large subunit